MNERLIFGIIIPTGIFIISIVATLLIYRRFARHSDAAPKEEDDKNKD